MQLSINRITATDKWISSKGNLPKVIALLTVISAVQCRKDGYLEARSRGTILDRGKTWADLTGALNDLAF